MDRTKIIDRIRKLRSRTVDRGASEAEMAGQAGSTALAVRANKEQLARQVADQFRLRGTERQPPKPQHLGAIFAGQIDGQAIAIGKPLEGREATDETPLFAG